MYLNTEQWELAIQATQQALEKGGLRNEGMAHLVVGMARFNGGDYNEAMNELAKAQQFDASRGMATQWLKFVEGEKRQFDAYTSVDS
jgi:tetratricopeptide (TPR) repeat protein